MAYNHQLQRSRFELKYIIDEPTARLVRDFARCHLQRDEHAIPLLKWAYPIYSVYLDSPGYSLYKATVEGHKNRYKLRIRWYDDDPAHPVFFEVKRRVNDVILKDRAMVRRQSLKSLMAGRHPLRADLAKPDDMDAWWALQRFCELSSNLQADGRVIVHYLREAWVTPSDDNVRLTFDYGLAGAHWEGALHGRKWIYPQVDGVVLELKFDNRFPIWMRELVRSCNLYRTCMAKYVACAYSTPRQDPLLCHL